MTRFDKFALLLSILTFAAAAFVSLRVYEGMAHIEDEMAYVWQAQVIARGQLVTETPGPCPKCFLVPFVVDYNGLRFGKYPPGWPALLAFGESAGLRAWVNPLITGLSAWLLYRLVKKLLDERTALLAQFLFTLSPFVLLNAGSLLSHPWSLLLALIFILGWLDAFTVPNPALPARWARTLPAVVSALALGLLALTRPLTAVGVALPFALHGLYLLLRGDCAARLRLVLFALLAGGVSAMYLLWQYALTGHPLLNPYTLWWPYDQIGFGQGVGLQPGGYRPIHGLLHTRFTLRNGLSDLFGWPMLSWIFLPFGLWHARKNGRAMLVSSVLVSLVLAYGLYWIGSWVYGPRYYYEAVFVPVFLTAAGIRWLAGMAPGPRPLIGWARARFVVTGVLVGVLAAGSLLFYTPMRVGAMQGYARISSSCLEPFHSLEADRPLLIFVHIQDKYNEYGCLLDLTNPFYDTEIIPAISYGENTEEALRRQFPGRAELHYYADMGVLLDAPRLKTPSSGFP